MYQRRTLIRIVFTLIVVAIALGSFYFSSGIFRLQTDHQTVLKFISEFETRDSPNIGFVKGIQSGIRVDQVIRVDDDVLLMQSRAEWVNSATGELSFETKGLFGVNRNDFSNNPTMGDHTRSGHFYLPPNTLPTSYQLWDTQFVGPVQLTFDREEELEGLRVLVFHLKGQGIDETEGYNFLQDIPERYEAHTDGEGWLHVEPTTGIIVRYNDQGRSYWWDHKSNQSIADFYRWTSHYHPETEQAQLNRVQALRTRYALLRYIVPVSLTLLAVVFLLITGRNNRSLPLPTSS